ncbi:hypothetical protein ACQEU6_39720 [Spirillospora sp. CA-108201]
MSTVADQPPIEIRLIAVCRHVLPPDASGAIPQPRVYDLREAGEEEIRTTLEQVRHEMATTGPNPLTGPGLDVRLSLLPGDRGRRKRRSRRRHCGWRRSASPTAPPWLWRRSTARSRRVRPSR